VVTISDTSVAVDRILARHSLIEEALRLFMED
jgi:hypothetical protein